VPELQVAVAPEAGRLLRVLFVWHNEVSTDSATARMLPVIGYAGLSPLRLPVAHRRNDCATDGGIDSFFPYDNESVR